MIHTIENFIFFNRNYLGDRSGFFLYSIDTKKIIFSSLTDIVRVCVKSTLWRRVSRRVLPKFIRAILQQTTGNVHY